MAELSLNFIKGFVQACREQGLHEKQAAAILDTYAYTQECMDKAATIMNTSPELSQRVLNTRAPQNYQIPQEAFHAGGWEGASGIPGWNYQQPQQPQQPQTTPTRSGQSAAGAASAIEAEMGRAAGMGSFRGPGSAAHIADMSKSANMKALMKNIMNKGPVGYIRNGKDFGSKIRRTVGVAGAAGIGLDYGEEKLKQFTNWGTKTVRDATNGVVHNIRTGLDEFQRKIDTWAPPPPGTPPRTAPGTKPVAPAPTVTPNAGTAQPTTTADGWRTPTHDGAAPLTPGQRAVQQQQQQADRQRAVALARQRDQVAYERQQLQLAKERSAIQQEMQQYQTSN